MLNPFQKRNTDILLINSDGVSLLCWENKRLSRRARYATTPEDLAEFQRYVESNPGNTFVLIADCIEEDFRSDTFAHVSGSDRAELLSRKLAFAFRNSPYRIARVVGREKEGRRDDKVLLSALTKPELLEPWVKRLLASNAAIRSVTSAAYMMELFAQALKLKNIPHLMLVNLEAESGLRQTYLQNGRALFSRLTPVNKDPGKLVDTLREQCEQTRKYIERIKLLPYDKPLDIHVFTAFTQHEIDLSGIQTDLMTFRHSSTHELAGNASIDMDEGEVGALAVSIVQVLEKGLLQNIYAALPVRRHFYIQGFSRALGFVSAAALLAMAVVATPAVLRAFDNWELEAGLVRRTQPLLAEYEELRQRFPETPIPSKAMELVVKTYESILAQSHQPAETLALVSEALTGSPGIRLIEIDWRLVETPDETGLTVAVPDASGSSSRPAFQQAVMTGRTALKVRLRGTVDDTDSHRDAQNQVLAFVTALSAIPGATVEPLELPMDVSPEIAVSATLDGGIVDAAFILELGMGAQQ